MVTVYTPNSQEELARLPHRMTWEEEFLEISEEAGRNQTGDILRDLNVAHKEIDLKNPKTNRKNAGFSDEEREKFSVLLENGFIDTFRYFTRRLRVPIPGGPTVSMRERRTPDGALTISWYPLS